jgi:hypothetical protein
MSPKKHPESVDRSVTIPIPELDQSKAAVLNTLASQHSRRSYEYAIERFIAWYCSEPRLTSYGEITRADSELVNGSSSLHDSLSCSSLFANASRW